MKYWLLLLVPLVGCSQPPSPIHIEQPTNVWIAFDNLDRPLGWGTSQIEIKRPGYLRSVAKFDPVNGQTITVMYDETHILPGEIINVKTRK